MWMGLLLLLDTLWLFVELSKVRFVVVNSGRERGGGKGGGREGERGGERGGERRGEEGREAENKSSCNILVHVD